MVCCTRSLASEWLGNRLGKRGQVYSLSDLSVGHELEHVPSQSYAAHRRHRLVRGPDHWFSPALRPRHRSASSARADLDQCNGASDGGLDWIAQQITEAFPWGEAPRYLIRDRDAVYGAVVTRRLRAMGIRDKPISAGSPWQNGFAERLIGTIRRECVDHLVVFGEAHACIRS